MGIGHKCCVQSCDCSQDFNDQYTHTLITTTVQPRLLNPFGHKDKSRVWISKSLDNVDHTQAIHAVNDTDLSSISMILILSSIDRIICLYFLLTDLVAIAVVDSHKAAVRWRFTAHAQIDHMVKICT